MRAFVLLILSVTLSGCGLFSGLLDRSTDREVSTSVAVQALGTGAISVDPFTPTTLRAPGIFRIRSEPDGSVAYQRICRFDTERLPAITSMRRVSPDEFAGRGVITDRLEPGVLTVSVPGVSLETRYTLLEVTGFEVSAVEAATSVGTTPEFIYDNVLDACRRIIDNAQTPILIAVAVATSTNIESISRGGVDLSVLSVGGVTAEVDLSGSNLRVTGPRRVFAVAGMVIGNDAERTRSFHGSF